jgi:shikimate kinase
VPAGSEARRSAPRHVVVVGLMGAGKTSVGRELARRLAWPHVDSDASLAARLGETARDLVHEAGAEELHRIEADLLLEALATPGPSVISAAASTIEVDRCRVALAAPDIFVVWLRADPSILADRARRGRHRPELDPDLDALLRRQSQERGPLFESVADLTLDPGSATPTELVDQLEQAAPIASGG